MSTKHIDMRAAPKSQQGRLGDRRSPCVLCDATLTKDNGILAKDDCILPENDGILPENDCILTKDDCILLLHDFFPC